MEPKIKTKVRFTSLDIAAMIQELKDKLVGCRITNIYDISPSTYLFKMSRGDDKHYLICQNGMRFHTTETKAEKNKMPSGFTMKFRKFLRSKRLEAIRQVGMERVVVLTFGSDQFCNHLILELYSQGNIILTDKDYRIIQCIRTHQFNEKVKTAVGQLYPFELAANIYLENIDISQDKIRKVIQDDMNAEQKEQKETEETQKKASKKKKQQKKQALKLKDIIFKLIPCLFPQVIDHILAKANFNPNDKCSEDNIQMISKAAEAALAFTKQFQSQKHKGYVVQNPNKEDFIDYAPYLHTMFENKTYKTFDSFSQAVDTYYAVFKKPQEGQELQELAWRKYEQIKKDQESRLGKLRTEQEESQLKAELIVNNLQDVDAVIGIFKRMLDEGYSWSQIDKMLQQAKKQGDPLANMIHGMNFQKGTVELLLGDPEEQLTDLVAVEVDVEYNAYTNASNYFESRKKNHQKELRTKEASEQVLKIAEREAVKDLEKRKNQRQAATLVTRKPYWFEKFYWFITTQNYLVVSGRDSHQNEMIVKKYMKPGDLYMHSDYGGAASTLIKNPTKEPVPRASLEQSAIFTVCRSKAWDTKIISGAWWVYHDQVSKSAPTGEFLPAGSFMIRGKRNFVYPNKMQMGITLLYRISADCVARHVKEKAEQIQEIAKMDSQKSEIETAHQQKINEEEFAIISLEQAPKKVKNALKQTQVKKEQTKQAKQKPKKQPTKQESDDDESEEVEEPQEQKPKGKQQAKKKEPEQPKKPHVNKKKLKKLEKYLEEQDEEERQVIMKMLGAKEMKHMRDSDEEEEDNKKKDKKTKKDKFNLASKDEQQTIDKEKVPFLKEQVENKWTKGKREQAKKEEAKKEAEEQKKQPETKEQPTLNTEQPVEEVKEVKETKEVKQIKQETKQVANQQGKETPSETQQQTQQPQKNSQSSSEGQQPEEQKKEQVYDEDDKALDEDINELTRLVGKVYPQDTFDCLITMCAPYPTITENHFKIKLTPGGLKKGKAARNILHYFSTVELTEREKPLLKTYPEQEIINALLGNVKLAAAGMLKLQMKEKAEKKEKRKQKDKQKAQK